MRIILDFRVLLLKYAAAALGDAKYFPGMDYRSRHPLFLCI